LWNGFSIASSKIKAYKFRRAIAKSALKSPPMLGIPREHKDDDKKE
jgi:hypothetical protein